MKSADSDNKMSLESAMDIIKKEESSNLVDVLEKLQHKIKEIFEK